ncbi:elongin-A isoform X1 [Phascolarctos cinereus]|uniref:Elongin-A isoform X1 n=1 Tax=Phascolarctos cinereus TaxID=38626 RepID=A0A6P5K0K7_PHACI|nr:elongin-A isoform X1 [Phascolarctos cinereus]
MAAESVLEVVERLQSRLAGNPEPKKLLKHLKRLSDLPITVDILAETGVGKTVNGLRKHEQVGGFAKDLVARWKKLVPVAQEVERNIEPEEQDLERNISRKRPRDVFPKEEEMEVDCRESWKASCSQPHSPDWREKKHRKLSELERMPKASHSTEPRDERKRWNKTSPFCASDHELSDGSHVHSPQPSTSPQQFSMDYDEPQEEEEEQQASHRKVGKSHSHFFQDRELNSQERRLGEPQDRVSVGRSKEHKTSQKEKHRLDTKEEKTFLVGREKVPKTASREEGLRSPSGASSKEKQMSSGGARREREKESSSSKKKPLPPLEVASVNHMKKTKHKDAQKSRSEKTKPSVDSFDGGKWEGELSPKPKEKGGSNSLKTREGKSKASNSDRKPASHFAGAGETDVDDDYEQPTMSFESYLSYDQPQRKKKKVVKTTSGMRAEKSHSKQNGSKADHKNSNNTVQKLPKMSESKAEKQHSGPSSAKLKKVSTDVTPTLPDIPLPTIQANYRPLPSLELIPSFQPKRKVSSPHEDEEAGFTGRRMNSKMQVYSGSKCAYLPKMMSLHQQCIRVLNNNIDSIYEVGGVPYSVLEPVLERCTPEQLYRIEECNHVLTEETDQLWKIHCHRDFKRERPEEFESWREMYLRLQDAREQRLLLLTENIRSAHANKPKGRQAKMAFVNSVAKPPRDVRRRQEKFGTGGAAVPEKIKIKPAPYTSNSGYTYSSSSGGGSGGSYNSAEEGQPYDGPSTSSAHCASAVSSTVSYDPRKPPVKKIAPMMAKTIKAFKNRFSRR